MRFVVAVVVIGLMALSLMLIEKVEEQDQRIRNLESKLQIYQNEIPKAAWNY